MVVHALAQGYSGIRIEVLNRIIWHIDNGVIPVVPEKGSVGASGDVYEPFDLAVPQKKRAWKKTHAVPKVGLLMKMHR